MSLKIHIANYEPGRIGGGWTFSNYFAKLFDLKTYDESEIYFIAGPTMVQRAEVLKAKDDGKKIVLRLDNAVRDSRNRNTGMSRVKDFSELADLVIYQSKWAKRYLMQFTKKDGPVILNGTDLDIFYPGTKQANSLIYSRENRDETKNWEVARYIYSQMFNENNKLQLYIVGKFSDELRSSNFDFYNGEQFTYLPTLRHEDYAVLLRSINTFIYSYFNDACSNSLIEARACGCMILDPLVDMGQEQGFLDTGGAKEIMEMEDLSIGRMGKEYEQALRSII